RSALSGSTDIEYRPSRHLFLRLPALADKVREWLNGKGDWDPLVLGVAHGWLAQGLQERCITRDIAWGVPVPRAGYERKTFYVWFDAPIGYLALIKEWATRTGHRWEDWLAQ